MQWSWGLSNEDDLADQAGHLQHLLGHGRPAGLARSDHHRPGGLEPSRRSASFTVTPEHGSPEPDSHLRRLVVRGSGRHDHEVRVGPRRRRDLRDQHGHNQGRDRGRTPPRAPSTVRLRVTDNGGATDVTVRTLTVIGNLPPTASFTATPNPAIVGQTVTFNGIGSSDPDGTIAKYEWDLDGNGTYETNSGTHPDGHPLLRDPGHADDRPARHRQRRQDGDDDASAQRQQRRRQLLRRRGPRHRRPDPLLAPGRDRGPDLRRQRRDARPATASGGVTLGVPGRRRRRPEHGRALRRLQRRGEDQCRPVSRTHASRSSSG